MIVVLPNKKYGLLDVEKKMNSAYLSKIRSAYSSEVILDLPKFRIESMIEPKDEIEKLGYSLMFSNDADFSRMTKDKLKIGKIIHKTFIEVDEKRTEAAAVTEIDMVVTGYGGGEPKTPPPPKIFNADHPFMFLIMDNRTGAVLFTGRFVRT